jgi:hypothetical protein
MHTISRAAGVSWFPPSHKFLMKDMDCMSGFAAGAAASSQKIKLNWINI